MQPLYEPQLDPDWVNKGSQSAREFGHLRQQSREPGGCGWISLALEIQTGSDRLGQC